MDLKGFIQELIKNDQLREQAYYGLLALAIILFIVILLMARPESKAPRPERGDRILTPRRTNRPAGSPMATKSDPKRRNTADLGYDWGKMQDPRD